jgi:CubicO group peptidase (beta-lactamase class C family)
MTKPITVAAAMILVEEGTLDLDGPIDKWLPELARRRVLTRLDASLDDTVPAERPVTLRDLLTFRMGLGMVWGKPGALPIQRAIAELGIVGFGPPDQATPIGPDEWLRRLGTLPLMYQPGVTWMYNTGSYVLGVLIARATGQSFGRLLAERIFEPLGMNDTGFSVPEAKLDRLAASYWLNAETGSLDLYDGIADSHWNRPPVFEDGGAGLVSTADDYLAFARMLLNHGKHGPDRLLSDHSVALMTTDHMTPAQKSAPAFFPALHGRSGWGFGVSVGPDGYGWDGGFGTSWANNPAADQVAILMTQRAQFPAQSPIHRDFWAEATEPLPADRDTPLRR